MTPHEELDQALQRCADETGGYVARLLQACRIIIRDLYKERDELQERLNPPSLADVHPSFPLNLDYWEVAREDPSKDETGWWLILCHDGKGAFVRRRK